MFFLPACGGVCPSGRTVFFHTKKWLKIKFLKSRKKLHLLMSTEPYLITIFCMPSSVIYHNKLPRVSGTTKDVIRLNKAIGEQDDE